MDSGRLALGVSDHRVVALLGQVEIIEEDASRLVACAGEGDDTTGRLLSTAGKQCGLDQVEEQKVAKVVGAKLSLETIDGATLGDCHDTSIQHEDIRGGQGARQCAYQDSERLVFDVRRRGLPRTARAEYRIVQVVL